MKVGAHHTGIHGVYPHTFRRELESRGARFRTQTDTEVVLHAYATWGGDCFERFNGMWALALWDERERQLVLSRDRFAIKPLCYAVKRDRVCFASEPKAIAAAFPEEREPDRAEIARFLAGAYPDAGEATFFANVRNVPAATCIAFTADDVRRTRYWHFVPGDETPKPDAEEHFRALQPLFVKYRGLTTYEVLREGIRETYRWYVEHVAEPRQP